MGARLDVEIYASPEQAGLAAGICGDDYLDPGEECDDGNREPGDGCSELCEIEAP